MTHVQAFLKDDQTDQYNENQDNLYRCNSLLIFQKTAYQSGKQNLQQNNKSEQQYLIHSVSEKSNMKTFREHLKTQECTEISPDEYQQNNYSPLAEVGVFSTEIKIMCLVSCAA